MHGYREAIRQLAPEYLSAMQKLGATLLIGLSRASAVDLITLGSQLGPNSWGPITRP